MSGPRCSFAWNATRVLPGRMSLYRIQDMHIALVNVESDLQAPPPAPRYSTHSKLCS